jgi:hypothetical protein
MDQGPEVRETLRFLHIQQVYSYASVRGLVIGVTPAQHFLKKQKLDGQHTATVFSPDQAKILLEAIGSHSKQTCSRCRLSLNIDMRFG